LWFRCQRCNEKYQYLGAGQARANLPHSPQPIPSQQHRPITIKVPKQNLGVKEGVKLGCGFWLFFTILLPLIGFIAVVIGLVVLYNLLT
jgi:hypothetical protein